MRLASLKPPLASALLEALGTAEIHTSDDLLLPDTFQPLNLYLRSIFTRLPPGIIEFQELINLASRISSEASASGISGAALLAQTRANAAVWPVDEFASGVRPLDEIAGGFAGGRVMEVSGTPSTGKTALALFVVLRHLVRFENSAVLWIDTTNDTHFSRKLRAAHVVASSPDAPGDALDRFRIAKAYDSAAGTAALDAATRLLEAQASAPGALVLKTRMIVVDSVTDLFAPELKDKTGHGHVLMTDFMMRLRLLARKYMLSVMVLNGSARISAPDQPPTQYPLSHFGGNSRPALGSTFTFLTDSTLWMTKFNGELGSIRSKDGNDLDEREVRIVEMVKARDVTSSTWCAVWMRRDGGVEGLEPSVRED